MNGLKKERLVPNCFIEMQAPKQQTKNFPKSKKHNSEFHQRIVMKKGTTRDFSRMIYGPKPYQANLNIPQKSKAINEYSNMKPLSRKNRRHLKKFDVSKAFIHPPIIEPNVSMHH
jgi:hypothetical protein